MTKQIPLKLVLLPAVLGAAVLYFMPAVSSAAVGTVTCTGDLTGRVDANVDVPAGQACRNNGFEITGNVTVEGSLAGYGGTYDKNVIVRGGGTVSFGLCFSALCRGLGARHIAGDLTITGSSSNNYVGATVVQQNVTVEGNDGAVNLELDNFVGTVDIDRNTGGVGFFDDRIGRNLDCNGNVPAPIATGQVSVTKTTGRCGTA
jgi:hypothetical protein